MSERSSVSRRQAAALIAGTLAASAGAAAPRASAAVAAATGASGSAAPRDGARRIAGLLADVRRAPSPRARTKAFARFKAALHAYDAAETPPALAPAGVSPSRALYRHHEPGAVLAGVIIRELDEWSPADAAWMSRFSDLETVVRARVRLAG